MTSFVEPVEHRSYCTNANCCTYSFRKRVGTRRLLLCSSQTIPCTYMQTSQFQGKPDTFIAPKMSSSTGPSFQGQQSNATSPQHLVVIQHGLIGSFRDMALMALKVEHAGYIHLNSNCSPMLYTLDGVDVCGDRLVEEVVNFTQASTLRGVCIKRISFIGYSLGGGCGAL